MTSSRSVVGLGRGDLQQRDQLAGGGQPVLDEAVVGQFGQFLDPDAGHAQDLHGGPGPERAVFLAGQVAALAGAGVLGPDAGRWSSGRAPARRSVCPAAVNCSPGAAAWRGLQRVRRRPARGCRRRRPGRAGRAAVRGSAGPSGTCGGGVPSCGTDLAGADRAGHRPRSPPGRVVQRPLGDVEVERPDRGQAVGGARPRAGDLGDAARRAAAPDWSWSGPAASTRRRPRGSGCSELDARDGGVPGRARTAGRACRPGARSVA